MEKKRIVIFGLDEYDTNAWHFRDAFAHLGHEAAIVGTVQGYDLTGKVEIMMSKMNERFERYVTMRLVKKALALKPDILVNLIRLLHPDLVTELRKKLPGIKIVNFNADHLSNFDRQQLFASDYDAFFSKEPFIVDFMRNKMGLNAHYLPEYVNPRIHVHPDITKAEAEAQTGIDVLVFGSFYPYRTRLLRKLVKAGINISIYGLKSKYFPSSLDPYFHRGFIRGERKSALIYGAKIVFNNFHYAEITSANQKYFEINGIGGFQICDFKETLQEYSPVPSGKYTYRTIDGAIDLIKYYLERPEERYEIAEKQYKHFVKHHTIDIRAQKILDILEGEK